jgi:hypothetical protein
MESAEMGLGALRPMHGRARVAGVRGVPLPLMVDFDEMPIMTAKAKRRRGHGFIGQKLNRPGQVRGSGLCVGSRVQPCLGADSLPLPRPLSSIFLADPR